MGICVGICLCAVWTPPTILSNPFVISLFIGLSVSCRVNTPLTFDDQVSILFTFDNEQLEKYSFMELWYILTKLTMYS